MAKRLFLIYLLVELAVLVALVSTVGFGWTVLAVLATFMIGLVLAGSQVARHLRRLQAALNSRSSSSELATDSALVALGAILVVVPGLASSALGALLLMPPTRRIARPVAAVLVDRAGRNLTNAAPLRMTYMATGTSGPRYSRADFVDGEVIDVVDIGADEATSDRRELPVLEHRRTTGD